MWYKKLIINALLLFSIGSTGVSAQCTITASGGDASGTGGTVNYSVGQIVYTIIDNSSGSVTQGVQQPYEISVISGFEAAKEITFEFVVYPNPVADCIKLVIKNFDTDNLGFLLFDMSGSLLLKSEIKSIETDINMGNYLPATYLLKVIQGRKEIKTFKIIKN